MRAQINSKWILTFLFLGVIPFGVLLWQDAVRVAQNNDRAPTDFRDLPLSAQLELLEHMGKTKNITILQEFVKSSYPDNPPNKHELAHKLGEIAVKQEGIEGFALCDTLLNYGCFHGAALATVRMQGFDADLGEHLWEGCKRRAKFPGNCLHGLGHALMILKQYNLLASYEACERIVTGDDIFWCQDGVSMENVTRSMANAGLLQYGSETDPYYPCNSIPQKYEAVCVRNHLGFLQRNFSFNQREVANFCLSFKQELTREECVRMIGSIEVQNSFDNPEKVINICKTANDYFPFCVDGGAIAFSMAKQFGRARQLCEFLSDGKEYEACIARVESFEQNN